MQGAIINSMSRSSRAALALLAALLLAACVVSPAAAVPRDPRLAGVESFAFGIGSGVIGPGYEARLAPYDLVVVDAQEASAGQVARLRARGALVLGYLSIGTVEPGRPWTAAARPYRLDRYAEFGEDYADTSRAGFRALMARRVAPALLRKRFDGLFLDNTDMIENHPRQAVGMRLLVGELARLVHGQGRLLFAQNGEDVINPILRHLDGWNREDVTSTYDFDRRRYARVGAAAHRQAVAALRRIGAAGKLVTATDYVRAGDVAGTAASIRAACAAGALPFVSDIALRRVAAAAPRCP